MCLGSAIASSQVPPFTVTLNIYANNACNAGGSLAAPAFTQFGYLWIDDEKFHFNSCTSLNGGGNCGTGSTQLFLSVDTRGLDTQDGWTGAVDHNNVNGRTNANYQKNVNLACPDPRKGGTYTSPQSGMSISDFPPSRHPNGSYAFDASRNRVWLSFGYQETFGFQDTWYEDLATTTWHRLPGFSTGGAVPASPEYTEGDMIYDPQNDMLFEFGGSSGLTHNISSLGNVMPLGTVPAWLSSTAADQKWQLLGVGSSCTSAAYVPCVRYANGGDPGGRDASRMVYDTVRHKVLIFGGTGKPTPWLSVAQIDLASGEVCLSDGGVQGGRNSSTCSLPPLSGSPPPYYSGSSSSSKWPLMAWDPVYNSGSGGVVVLCCAGQQPAAYVYDPVANSWTTIQVNQGPLLPTLSASLGQQSLDYDAANAGFLLFVPPGTGGGMWQLTESAISGQR